MNFVYHHFGCAWPCISNEYLYTISIRLWVGGEVGFLQADKAIFSCKLIVSIWLCVGRYAQSTENNNFGILRMKLNFCQEINKDFFKLILSSQVCVCVARNAQITQNNKSVMSLQHLKKEMSDEVDFLHPYKHKVSYKLALYFLMGTGNHSKSFQNSNFAMSLQCYKK